MKAVQEDLPQTKELKVNLITNMGKCIRATFS
jgi:hypothetical protein